MKKILPIVLTLLLILSCGNADAQSRKERRAQRKAAKQAAQLSAQQSITTSKEKEEVDSPTSKHEKPEPQSRDHSYRDLSYYEELNRELTPSQIDSLVALWQEQQTLNSYQSFFNDYIDFDEDLSSDNLHDSVYINRLQALVSPIKLPFNSVIKNYIARYVNPRYGTMNRILSLSRYYFPLIEEELIKAGLPVELRALPIIESALSTTATSPMGAVGLWQFMPTTGKSYGLEINSFVDERRDPVLATKAAVQYLKDLYRIYNDWTLAIAAYNCGPGNVNKAIRRSGGKRNYWDIYYYLPRETRGYVPAFIAVNYAFRYHKEHGIAPMPSTFPPLCDTLVIADGLHFEQIASQVDLSVEELRDLNPQYRADVIPAGYGKTYTLQLPYDYVGAFIDRQDTIFAHNRSRYFDDSHRTADPRSRIKVHAPDMGAEGKARLLYTVREGDVPGAIALKFGVRLADLRYWNNLNKRMTIRVGQRLVVYVPEEKLAQYKSKAAYAGKVDNTAPVPREELAEGEYTLYTIKSGDNLWDIAKKYPGITNRDIMRWNGLSDADVKRLKPGQQLKIKI